MKYENKDLVLLIWNARKCRHDEFIVNPALQQSNKTEFHVLIGQEIGDF